MRMRLLATAIGFGAMAIATAPLVHAQASDKSDKKREPRRITLSGCVERGPGPNDTRSTTKRAGSFV